MRKLGLAGVVLLGVGVSGCAVMFSRRGLDHYVTRAVPQMAVRCGAFQRLPARSIDLTADEQAGISECVDSALASGRDFVYYVTGYTVDSRIAWGEFRRQGKVWAFWYDSAPCGTALCRERFEKWKCPSGQAMTVQVSPCKRPGS